MKSAKRVLTSNIFWVILFLILAFICVFVILNMRYSKDVGKMAYIYSDNKLIKSVSLSIDDEFEIKNEDNYNIIRVRDGKISVIEADCRNQICVRQGEIDSDLFPIVCVPNGLVIRVSSYDSQSDIDAQT